MRNEKIKIYVQNKKIKAKRSFEQKYLSFPAHNKSVFPGI